MFKFLLLLILFTACSTNPVTGKKEFAFISEREEVGLGENNYYLLKQAQGGEYTAHEEIDEYVKEIGHKIASVSDRAHLPFEFVVVNSSIPNAWALPGGKIAIYRGLLQELENEAELAAVISHEVAHSAARHGAQNIERSILMSAGLVGLAQIMRGHKYEDLAMVAGVAGASLASLKYSREAELEADHYGIKYMTAAGYDPQAAVTLQEKFIKLNDEQETNWLSGLFSTHPPSEERKKANIITAAKYNYGGTFGEDNFKKKMALFDRKAYDNLDQGYEALLNDKPEEALTLAENGIALEPNEPHLFNLKGKAAQKLKNYTLALESYNHAVKLYPRYFDFYLQRGLLKQEMGKLESAYRDLNQSVALLPSDEGYFAMGEIAFSQKKYPLAVTHFRMAAQADTKTGDQARVKLRQMMR